MWPFRLGVASLSCYVLGPVLAHLGALPPLAGFGIFLLADLLGAAGLSWALSDRFSDPNAPWLAAAALSAAPALSLIAFIARAISLPRINDVSTDLNDPPRFETAAGLAANQGRDMSFPAKFVSIVRGGYPDLTPIDLPIPPAEAYERALGVAKSRTGWEITRADEVALVFEATATSWLFGFQDDIAVRVRAGGAGSVIDMRSKSRDGKSDFGANAARIQKFLDALRG